MFFKRKKRYKKWKQNHSFVFSFQQFLETFSKFDDVTVKTFKCFLFLIGFGSVDCFWFCCLLIAFGFVVCWFLEFLSSEYSSSYGHVILIF